jgi:hypothetical protein
VKRGVLAVVGVLWLAVWLVSAASNGPSPLVPTPEAALRPGQELSAGIGCQFAMPDFSTRYCQASSLVDLVVRGNTIQRTYIFTFGSGLQLGDVMQVWGRPKAAEYRLYSAVDVYWADRWAYVLVQGQFSPFSRVGFVAYGEPSAQPGPWCGYRTSLGRSRQDTC